MRTEVESTVSHAASQLEKAQESLQKTAALMGEQEVCLQNLAQSYSDPDHPKVAAPVPIPEE